MYMKTLNNVKLAAFTGLVVGAVHGTVDIIARIAALSFEWFELYQALLIPFVAYTLGFVVLSLFIELIRRILKLNITKKTLTVFYFTTSVILLITFYPMFFINRVLLVKISFWNPISLAINFTVFFVLGILYILLNTKAKDTVYSFMNLMKKWKINKIIKNYIFGAIIFIVISLFLDLYLLNYFPNFESNADLDEYPNIILISIDSLRADHLSLYGYSLNTSPNLDEFAKDAVVFDNSIGTAPGSLASVPAILSGKYSTHHNVTLLNQELSSKLTTLPKILKAKGYNTAGFVSVVYIKAKYGFGQDFITYKDRIDFFEWAHTREEFGLRQTLEAFIPGYSSLMKQDADKAAPELNKDVFRWLDKNKDNPFFMYIHYYDPHAPFNLGKEFRTTNDTRDYFELEEYYKNQKRYEYVPKDVIDAVINLYDAEIMYVDQYIGKLLNKLYELDIKNNTMIIITADHGEEFYDHGYFFKSSTLYQEIIHIPLIIYYPKEFNPRRIEETVSHVDILPTILDVLGIEVPADVDGMSLVPLIKNGSYNREFVAAEIYGRPGVEEAHYMIAIISGDWKLIELRPKIKGVPSALYNLKTDPKEQRNLYDIYVEKRNELRKYIVNVTSIDEKNRLFPEG